MKKKYLVFPGYVNLKDYVGARQLMDLYGVKPSECIVIRYEHYEEDIAGLDKKDFICLYPSSSGDYRL